MPASSPYPAVLPGLPTLLFLISLASTNALRIPFFRRRPLSSLAKPAPHVIPPVLPPTSSGFPPDTLSLTPIGHVKTIYPLCVGTPRQPSLVPTSRATLLLNLDRGSTIGLEDFTHIWLVFTFHLNTTGKKQRLKISPPSLGGTKVGVLGTRSPHRPNNLGFTLARLEKISFVRGKPLLTLSGTDLVDGTPVYDIKPYVPSYDSVPAAMVPSWIEKGIEVRRSVVWKCDRAVSTKLRMYKKGEEELFLKVRRSPNFEAGGI